MMASDEQDPAGNTQQFRAFANSGDSAPAGRGGMTGVVVIIGAAVAVVVIIGIILLLV
jgi:hypothetical protein